MRRLPPTGRVPHAWLLAVVVAVFGCGHSSDTTGPSSGTTTAAQFDFGSNNPRTVSAFGDSITFGVLEERRIRAQPRHQPTTIRTSCRGCSSGSTRPGA